MNNPVIVEVKSGEETVSLNVGWTVEKFVVTKKPATNAKSIKK